MPRRISKTGEKGQVKIYLEAHRMEQLDAIVNKIGKPRTYIVGEVMNYFLDCSDEEKHAILTYGVRRLINGS